MNAGFSRRNRLVVGTSLRVGALALSLGGVAHAQEDAARAPEEETEDAEPAAPAAASTGASASGSLSVGGGATEATGQAQSDTAAGETAAPEVATEAASVPSYAGARATRPADERSRAARFASVPYMERYVPEPNLWEVGLFVGGFFPADDHNLKVPALPREEYTGAAFQLGARLGYFPLSYLGVEVEGMVAAGATETTDRSALFYGGGAHLVGQLPLASVVPFVLLGGGALGAVSEPMGHDGDPSFHFGLGAKIPFNHVFSARMDLRDTLAQRGLSGQGNLTHHFSAQLGATFTFERTAPPVLSPPDQDYDGLYDSEDRCPQVGALTSDGCPEDEDGDGIPDLDDECPTEAGEAPSGCPNKDLDGDGVPVPADQCPDEAGPAPSGCPDRDLDGDGFIENDQCPKAAETRNGFQDDDGCPDEMPEAVKRFTGVIRGINFKQGTAEIEEASYPTLDSAVEILNQHKSLRIEVSGHTSSEGSDQRNQELSVDRAAAVKTYLVEHGVDADRIETRGAGASEPIASNETQEGRRENRRIEFRILAQP